MIIFLLVTRLNGMSLNTSPKRKEVSQLPTPHFWWKETCFQCSGRQLHLIYLEFQHHHISIRNSRNYQSAPRFILSHTIHRSYGYVAPYDHPKTFASWVLATHLQHICKPPLQSYRYTFSFNHHHLGSYCLMVQISQITTQNVLKTL